MRIRLLGKSGKPVRGYDWDDCAPITGDSVAHEVSWGRKKTVLPESAMQIEFSMKRARLFGFGIDAKGIFGAK